MQKTILPLFPLIVVVVPLVSDWFPVTTLRQIANKFQCGKTQIQSILRDQQNLLNKSTASGNAATRQES